MIKDTNIFDNKIIILYILENSTSPLTIDQIVKFCEDFDDITYFDVCSFIEILKSSNYISEQLDDNVMVYSLTEFGTSTLKELLELIPGVNLHNFKKLISRNANILKTEYSVNTNIFPIKNDEYRVSCSIKEGNDELINVSIYATSKDQAKSISNVWNNNSEEIYSKLLEMLTKEE